MSCTVTCANAVLIQSTHSSPYSTTDRGLPGALPPALRHLAVPQAATSQLRPSPGRYPIGGGVVTDPAHKQHGLAARLRPRRWPCRGVGLRLCGSGERWRGGHHVAGVRALSRAPHWRRAAVLHHRGDRAEPPGRPGHRQAYDPHGQGARGLPCFWWEGGQAGGAPRGQGSGAARAWQGPVAL